MTEQFLEDYFLGLATASVDINHELDSPSFFRISNKMDLDEFDNAVRSVTKNACLLLEIGSGEVADWDSQKDMPRCGMHVLIKSTEEYAVIRASRDQAKQILNKLVARIRYDCQPAFQRNSPADGPLRQEFISFDTRIKYEDIDGVDGNWYGKSFYFSFSAPLDIQYNPQDFTS